MKTKKLFAAVLFSLSGLVGASDGHDHKHEHQPLHGGQVVEVKGLDYELVVRPDRIQVHVRDHGQALAVTGGKARVTLLVGAGKQEIELTPAGQHFEFSGPISVAGGAKVLLAVTVPGRQPVTVRYVVR